MMSGAVEYFQYVLAPQMLIGLVLGIAVILVALGLTIIFGLLDVINMSHGEFYALGAFIAVALGTIGLPFWLLLILVPLVMLPIGYIVERGLIQRATRHDAAAHFWPRLGAGRYVRAGVRAESVQTRHPDRRRRRSFRYFPPVLPSLSYRHRRGHHRRGCIHGLSDPAGRHGARRGVRPAHGGLAWRARSARLCGRLCLWRGARGTGRGPPGSDLFRVSYHGPGFHPDCVHGRHRRRHGQHRG